jgi:hypothetical protein
VFLISQKNGVLNHTALKSRILALWQVLLTFKHTPKSTLTIDTKGKFFFNQHAESRRNRMSYIQYNGQTQGRMEVIGRRGGRQQLLDDLKEIREHCK